MLETVPRASFGDPSFLATREASTVERVLGSHLLAAALVVVTSSAFLVPAGLAWRSSRYWHAWLFASMGMICAVYHFCDTDMPMLLGSQESCGVGVLHFLTLLDHGWVYFCMLQVVLMVLGPEDPYLQWADPERSEGAVTTSRWPPIEVVAGSRLLPSTAMFLFLACYPSWQNFHWHCILLCNAMLLIGCVGFWAHPYRRNWATEVLLREHFWTRLYGHCCLPLSCTLLFFLVMEVTHSTIVYALFHVLIASFAVAVMQDVGNPERKVGDPIMEHSARNPFVAHHLMKAVAYIALPTLCITLGVDWFWSDEWQWPTPLMAASRRPGCYILMIGSMPTLLASATTFWLISSTLSYPYPSQGGDTWKTWWTRQLAQSKIEQAWPQPSDSGQWGLRWFMRDPLQWSHVSKHLGCQAGYLSILLGILVCLLNDDTPGVNILQTTVGMLFFSSALVAVFLTTSSSPWALTGSKWRHILAWSLILLVVGLSVLFVLVNVHNIVALHAAYASTEYLILALFAVWPATWTTEIRDSWVQRTTERFEWPATPWRFGVGPSMT